MLGAPETSWKNREEHSVVNLIPRIKDGDIAIIIDCGLDDFFLETNREMHKRLLEADIAHEYTERPGAHNGDYWTNAIDYQVIFFDKFFKR